MALTIAATSTVAHIPPPVAPPSAATPPANRVNLAAAPRPSAASAAPNGAQENAELNQLLNKYRTDLSQGQASGALTGLGRQIMAAAMDAGQHVNLPRAPGNAAAAAVAPPPPETGKINLTA